MGIYEYNFLLNKYCLKQLNLVNKILMIIIVMKEE